MSRPLVAAAWLACVGALPWLAGCSEHCSNEAPGRAVFNVELTAADGPLPADLSILLGGSDGTEERTMQDIAEDTSGMPSCWFGDNRFGSYYEDAGADPPERVACSWDWNGGPLGVFQASAAGYQPVSTTLLSQPQDCDCCRQWIEVSAKLLLEPE